ncbi:MAG: hypothetical protein M3Z21_16715 [Pseudomonadota bacterium]|nr:hypothetical protein [Pseudomonadota bacterium]
MTPSMRLAPVVAVLALLASPAAGASFIFTPVAAGNGDFDPFGFGAPVLNDSGLVAFNAALSDGTQGIFRWAGGPLAAIALENGFRRFGDPSINAAGQVGFEASLRSIRGEGIFRGDGGPVTPIAGTRDAGDFDFVNAGPSINAAGRVAFIGERIVGGAFIDGVYAGDGGPVAPIYDATGPFADFTGNPSLNDGGVAAFLATLDSGIGGLFLGSGGAFTTVADETGVLTSVFGFGDPSLNDRGEVAFRAGTNVGDPDDNSGATGEGIFLFSGGVLTPVLQGSFSDFSSLGDPSLNNLGQVAFLVEPDFGNQVLLTGPDLLADRVIGTGDTLAGRRVSGLSFSREGLNDSGQLAFTAFFEDGSAGVFLATPAAIPAPGSLALLLAGLAAALGTARRAPRSGYA